MTGFLACFIFGVPVIALAVEGNWWPAVIGVLLILAGCFISSENRKNAEAWYNRREYWRKGGPEQYRRGR